MRRTSCKVQLGRAARISIVLPCQSSCVIVTFEALVFCCWPSVVILKLGSSVDASAIRSAAKNGKMPSTVQLVVFIGAAAAVGAFLGCSCVVTDTGD